MVTTRNRIFGSGRTPPNSPELENDLREIGAI